MRADAAVQPPVDLGVISLSDIMFWSLLRIAGRDDVFGSKHPGCASNN